MRMRRGSMRRWRYKKDPLFVFGVSAICIVVSTVIGFTDSYCLVPTLFLYVYKSKEREERNFQIHQKRLCRYSEKTKKESSEEMLRWRLFQMRGEMA